MNIVEKLRQKNLLEVEKTKVVSQVSVKRGKEFILLKRFHNLLSLHECGLVDFLEKTFEEPEAVIVFGSFSR
ncbi:hypothetical protein H0N96_02760, partial [Candidatus Micrarchaeota archaeon]|nr:hypothetical protein [Candidatus Micrarchaeota archaeon]